MGVYVMKDISFFTKKDEGTGKSYFWAYARGFEKNVVPHIESSSLAFFGDLKGLAQYIGVTCACIEDGITQYVGSAKGDSHKRALNFAQMSVRKLFGESKGGKRDGAACELFDMDIVEQSINIKMPNFKDYAWAPARFGSAEQMRDEYAKLLEKYALHYGEKIYVPKNLAFLAEQAKFLSSSDAWGSREPRDRARVSLAMGVDDGVKPGGAPSSSGQSVVAPEIFGVRDAPGVYLVSQRAGDFALRTKFDIWEEFWKKDFPDLVLFRMARSGAMPCVP